MTAAFLPIFLSLLPCVLGAALPSSSPHVYPGEPSGDYSTKWQSYFEVTQSLPNVSSSWIGGRSYAGNIAVDRKNHPDDTLFFWAAETSPGSLTDNSSTEPWGIWLNGGPGSSSMIGFLFENGPVRINPNYSASPNPYSWDKIADYIWIDQPVGTGFSTADANGYIATEDQMGTDFLGFLSNLVKVFPSLATRPLILSGESYAGMYIPYILKTYFNSEEKPVKIHKIAIGDGSIGTWQGYNLLPAVSVMETFPQLISYDTEILEHFKAQSHTCGYDLNLTYPEDLNTPLPDIALVEPIQRTLEELLQARKKSSQTLKMSMAKRDDPVQREEKRLEWKRQNVAGPGVNSTLNSWYGCFLFDEMMDYALNYTFPWNATLDDAGFDYYDVPDALSPEINMDGTVFMNDKQTRTALHAPTDEDWEETFEYVFGENTSNDPSVEPISFLSELATNATAANIGVVLYSGNNDALIPHRGTEVTIQNTTFGGIRGFTRKPSTPFSDGSGNYAGIVHQERNWTFALFAGAGHLIPQQKPESIFTFYKEFVFGTNQTGLVTSADTPAIGGESEVLAADIMPGPSEIYVGVSFTQSTYVAPTATIAAWQAYVSSVNALTVATASPSLAASNFSNSASSILSARNMLGLLTSLVVAVSTSVILFTNI